MERYNNIGWEGLPFSMWSPEDKRRLLLLIFFWIFVIALWLYISIAYIDRSGHIERIVAENVRINVQLE